MESKWNYFLIGQGTPLVFIHGILGFANNFRSIANRLKEDYQCLLYDQRGHGKSFHQKSYTIQELAGDLKLLLKEVSFQQPHLIGHSLGGFVSLMFAHQYPESVKKLVLVDSSPEPLLEQGYFIKNLIESLPSSFLDRNQARDYFQKEVKENRISQVMSDFLFANLKTDSRESLSFQFDSLGLIDLLKNIRQISFLPLLSELKMPTLLIRGKHSSHFTKESFQKSLEQSSCIQGVEIQGAGHWIHHEQPQAFVQVVKDFLQS